MKRDRLLFGASLRFLVLWATVFFLQGSPAWAVLDCASTNDDQTVISGHSYYIVDQMTLTNYEPARGGINGHCGTSASGLNVCKYLLDDQVAGKSQYSIGAVPRQGGNSDMYGAIFRAHGLEKGINDFNGNPGKGRQPISVKAPCIRVIMGDHYGKGSNDKHKVDIATRAHSRLAPIINSVESPGFELIGHINELRARNGTRRVPRDPVVNQNGT
jgi:hypothetical protein